MAVVQSTPAHMMMISECCVEHKATQTAQMVKFASRAPLAMANRVEWRCATMMNGALCVVTIGMMMMPLWCAAS